MQPNSNSSAGNGTNTPVSSSTGKICLSCHKYKDYTLFGKHKKGKNGLRSDCKDCHNGKARNLSDENRIKKNERDTIYYKNNKDIIKPKVAAYHKKYRAANKDKLNNKSLIYFKNNPDVRKKIDKKRGQKERDLLMPKYVRRLLVHHFGFSKEVINKNKRITELFTIIFKIKRLWKRALKT